MQQSERKKVEAIFQLREAAAKQAHAERDLEASPSPDQKMALLDATLELDEKTQAAIEVCHECGHEHAAETPHRMPWARKGGDNVVSVDFTSTEADSENHDQNG